MKGKNFFTVFLAFVSMAFNAFPQQKAGTLYDGNAEKIKEWKADRFGMFIHWGPVSLSGREIGWSRGAQVPVSEYDSLYTRFNPVKFNADEWVGLAKAAGMRYIVLTTKHHDGFCLWNTRQTDHNIMHSPFGRDVVKELSDACRRQGIKFGVYYSTCDWHHPDFPVTSPGGRVRRDSSNLDAYTHYLKRQVAELLVNYGPLQVLWFDVPQCFDAKRGQGVIDFARSLQPDIIINDRTGADGDFTTPEQRIGGYNDIRPWETCMTIARQWSWKPNDNVKSLDQCLHTLIRTVGGDGNLLFNIGPKPDGSVEPLQVERLRQMGEWMKSYGVSVYGTKGGPYLPTDWGVSTRKGDRIYLHVLTWHGNNPRIVLPSIGGALVKSCRMLNGGKVSCRMKNGSYVLEFAGKYLDSLNTVIELVMDRDVMDVPAVAPQPQSLLFGHKISASSNPDKKWHGAEYVCNGDWVGLGWRPGKNDKQPWIEVDMEELRKVDRAILFEATNGAVKKFEIQAKKGDGWVTIYEGGGIGKRLDVKLPKVKTDRIRVVFTEISGVLEISEFIVLGSNG